MKKIVLALVLLILALAAWWLVRTPRPATHGTSAADAAPAPIADVTTSSTADADASEADATRVAAREPEPPAPAPQPRVRLLDERTGEPVPWFEVGIATEDGGVVKLESDADADVTLSAVVDTKLLLVENERAADRIQTRAEAAGKLPRFVEIAAADVASSPHEVRIPVGPTYRLDFALPDARYALADFAATLKPADPRSAFDSAFADVRDDATPWIRFRAGALFLSGGPPWRLELATRDGLWLGAAEVASNVGIYRELVAIELTPRARLFGTVHDDAGATIANHYVRIERAGASFASSDNRPLFGLVRADGSYEIRCVPAGTYAVRVHAEGHRDFETSVELVDGLAHELAIVCERTPEDELVHIEGRVTSESGAFRERLYVVAFDDASERGPHRCDVAWRDVEGRAVGSFAFDVPRAEHRIEIQGGRLIELDPRRQTWKPDDPALAFVVRDGASRGRIKFRATDPANGAEVADFRVRVTTRTAAGELFEETLAARGVALVEDVPLGRTYAYRVWGDGRQSVWGALTLNIDADEVVVSLPAGWGSVVGVTDPEGRPVARVRVLFDDELAGETDEHGELRVALDHVPETVRFERDGWHAVEDSTYSPESGRFRSWLPWLSATLARND